MTKKTIAIAYDFDGTLAKGNIQENSYIPDLRMSKQKFWTKVGDLAKKHHMDEILAYMYLLIAEAKSNGSIKFDKKNLKKHGKKVNYFDGVESFFDTINKYANGKGVKIEHYIISSGTKEMIEGTTIAKHFKYIYASSFKFDANDIPEWPALAVNYTNKTQFLFRINKGINNAWDNKKINKFTLQKDRPIPFKNIIFIGDGETDVPAMKLVKMQGGHSIGVYAPRSNKKQDVEKLLKENRANYVAAADYKSNSNLVKIIKGIIDGISARESISKFAKPPN